jgi:hypothetical protein
VYVQDICTQALRKLGVAAADEVPNINESLDAFTALNNLADMWQAERLMMYEVRYTVFNMTPGNPTYTVGPTGQVPMTRPMYIDHVNFINTIPPAPSLELQLSPLNADAWSKVPNKGLTSQLPTCWYWQQDYPNGTLFFWPVPLAATLQGVIYAPQAVPQFSALTATIALPPGYQQMLVYNLAQDLMSEYGGNVLPQTAQTIMAIANQSKNIVKTSNVTPLDASVDQATLPGSSGLYFYSIIAGP